MVGTVLNLDADHLGDPAWRVYLCKECAQQNGYKESQVIKGESGLDTLMAIEQSPVCQACFDELFNGSLNE